MYAGVASVLLLSLGRPATGQMLESDPAPILREITLSPPRLPLHSDDIEQREALGSVDRALDDLQRMIADAYFETALSIVDTHRDWLVGLGGLPGLNFRRARLEVLAATAEIALDRHSRALASIGRALRADPRLVFDVQRTSPKVRALVRESREENSPWSTP